MDACHPIYWELAATVYHVDPYARGGSHDEDNLVTCSMSTYLRKGIFTSDQTGMALLPIKLKEG